MGGELHPLKYGGYKSDTEKLFGVIRAEEEFILRSPDRNNRNIWVDLYDTELSGAVIAELVRHFITIKPKIHKLCLVGCSFTQRLKIKRRLKKGSPDLAAQIRFFSDPEEAKTWLVTEKYQ